LSDKILSLALLYVVNAYREKHSPLAKLSHEWNPEEISESTHQYTEGNHERRSLRSDVELLHKAEQSRHDTACIHGGEEGKERDTEQSSELHPLGPILFIISAGREGAG
jgi:hypothetical protein